MKPNMTLAALDQWTNTDAFNEYKRDRGASKVNAVLRRTRSVLRNNASEQERKKVEAFIARHTAQSAGPRKYGAGPGAVSAQTAALRNWGYDPTNRF